MIIVLVRRHHQQQKNIHRCYYYMNRFCCYSCTSETRRWRSKKNLIFVWNNNIVCNYHCIIRLLLFSLFVICWNTIIHGALFTTIIAPPMQTILQKYHRSRNNNKNVIFVNSFVVVPPNLMRKRSCCNNKNDIRTYRTRQIRVKLQPESDDKYSINYDDSDDDDSSVINGTCYNNNHEDSNDKSGPSIQSSSLPKTQQHPQQQLHRNDTQTNSNNTILSSKPGKLYSSRLRKKLPCTRSNGTEQSRIRFRTTLRSILQSITSNNNNNITSFLTSVNQITKNSLLRTEELLYNNNNIIPETKFQFKNNWKKHVGITFSTIGFVSSSVKSLLSRSSTTATSNSSATTSSSTTLNMDPFLASLSSLQQQIEQLWLPMYQSMMTYLQTTGIVMEVQNLINHRLLDNIIILSYIQQEHNNAILHGTTTNMNVASTATNTQLTRTTVNSADMTAISKKYRYYESINPRDNNSKNNIIVLDDRRDYAVIHDESNYLSTLDNDDDTIRMTKMDAIRYMRYATAVYGENMIRSAEIGRTGRFNTSSLLLFPDDESVGSNSIAATRRMRKRIKDYCNLVSEDDIIYMDIDHDSTNIHLLRHFIAIDHKTQQIVLSIRGTFSLAELFVDVAAFTRPFCDGEAHAEMASMAERMLEATEKTIINILKKYPSYELVLIGHSLGAGTAALLNVLLHYKNHEIVQRCKVKCVVFACPPVYSLFDDTKMSNNSSTYNENALSVCTNFIHENDCVPFLSVDSVRHLLNCLQAVEDSETRWLDRLRIIVKYRKPSKRLIESVHRAHTKRLPTLPGAPILTIPASKNIWLQEEKQTMTETMYDFKLCDATRLAKLGIFLDLDMFNDHLPSRYEYALHHLDIKRPL